MLIKLVGACLDRGLRLVVENPYGNLSYLRTAFLKPPTIIDADRTLHGDRFKKPTAYWFWNCEPTRCMATQVLHDAISVRRDARDIDRSVITSDYARNWICSFVLGKEWQPELSLF